MNAPVKPTKLEVPAVKPDFIAAVYGVMIDPHTGREFTLAPIECGDVTSWMQSQIDEGKLQRI